MYNFKTLFKYSIKLKFTKNYFIFLTVFFFIVLLLGNGAALLFKTLSNNDTTNNVVYLYGKDASELQQSLSKNELDVDVKVIDTYDKSVLNNEGDALSIVVNTETYDTMTQHDITEIDSYLVTEVIKRIQIDQLSINSNMTEDQIKKVSSLGTYQNTVVEQSGPGKDNNVIFYVLNSVFGVFTYILIMLGIQYIGAEIAEEKSSRAMELIITNSTSAAHLMAKVLSTLLYVISIMLSIVVPLLVTAFTAVLILGLDLGGLFDYIGTLFNGVDTLTIIVYVISLFTLFIITVLLYMVLMAVLASTASSQEEYQKLNGPVGMYLVIPYITVYFPLPPIVGTIMAFVPGFAMFQAPGLYISGDMSLLVYILSIVVQIIYLLILIKVGERIYKIGVLNYSDAKFKKIFKSAIKK